MRALRYNDLDADRQVVAAIQAMEAILAHAASGTPDGVVRIASDGTMTLHFPGRQDPFILYSASI
jgi:hypothetical protein